MGVFEQLKWAVAHDPCLRRFRTPYGALPTGSQVRLVLYVGHDVRTLVREVCLLVGPHDGSHEGLTWHEKPMDACDAGFACMVDVGWDLQALFYAFSIEAASDQTFLYVPCADGRSTFGQLVRPDVDGRWTKDGWRYVRRHESDERRFSVPEPLGGFQITVYDSSFTTPDWLVGSVMYQIFPDRFAQGAQGMCERGLDYHEEMGRPVRVHESWDELPEWGAPRADGKPGVYTAVDFYGGTLEGIRDKLPYLASLGVEVLYLNPVFEARSNHRYDTADYLRIDPLLGTNDDFEALAQEARTFGISILLDAVLSHTGDDSRYFNANEAYDEPGAAQGPESRFFDWYDFTPMENGVPYRCWWGHSSLPEVDERNASWQRFVFGDDEQVGLLPHWLTCGARGYRLDVADEIPDDVLCLLRAVVKRADPEAAILGEVWEDATTKTSYGVPRTYAFGRALDSVMNYPLRNALLGFALNTVDALQLVAFLNLQMINYPHAMHGCLMNLLSSHDTERQRSVLALGRSFKDETRTGQLRLMRAITSDQDDAGARVQRMIVALLYALPGAPCVYYGDEMGLQGGGDPFCRGTAVWSESSRAKRFDCGVDLTAFYQAIGQFRKGSRVLKAGSTAYVAHGADMLCVLRAHEGDDALLAVANRAVTSKAMAVDLSSVDIALPTSLSQTTMTNPISCPVLLNTKPGNGVVGVCHPEPGNGVVGVCHPHPKFFDGEFENQTQLPMAWLQDGIVHVKMPGLSTVYFQIPASV